MDATAILFSDLPRSGLLPGALHEMTGKRSLAALPFGCRYRLIDFSLSAMANAGMRKIGIVASYGDRELMEHIGSGKDWDLALRSGGIRFMPPEGVELSIPTRLTLLKGIRWAIASDAEPYVVLCDGDLICNADVGAMLDAHRKSGAEITIATHTSYLPINRHPSRSSILCRTDDDGQITDLYASSAQQNGRFSVCMHLYIINRPILIRLIDLAVAHRLSGFHHTLLEFARGRYAIRAYPIESYYAKIGSLAEYFACSMQLAKDRAVRADLFEQPSRPIYTRVRNSPPTRYREHAHVKCSLIADGCEIEGEVENSILFRGTRVARGASVRSSILFRGCEVSACTLLNCVVADNGSILRGTLGGVESLPYYIGEGVRL